MELYWAWYVLGTDTNTMKTPNQICAASVWIIKGGIKKNSLNIFSKFSPNLFEKAMYIDKDWAATYLLGWVNFSNHGTTQICVAIWCFSNKSKILAQYLQNSGGDKGLKDLKNIFEN